MSDASWVGSMPEVYDRCLGGALFAPFAEAVASRAGARSPADVLEVAAGTGIGTAALVRALPQAAVVATDLNPAMVSWGSARVPGATWQQADAQALPFPEASFDLVVCQFGVMFFPDKVAALAECRRVLRPGGALLLSVWDEVGLSPFPAALVESLAAVLPSDPPTFVARVPHGYADQARIRADLVAAGLTAGSVDPLVLRGSAPSAASLAEGFCLGTPLRFALQERGDLASLTEAVAAEMTARLGPGRVEGDLVAYVITALASGPQLPTLS